MSHDTDLSAPAYPVCASSPDEVYQKDLALAGRIRGTLGEVGTLEERVEEGLAGNASYPLEDRDREDIRREFEEAIVQEAQGLPRGGQRSAGVTGDGMVEATSTQASATEWLAREVIEEANREINRQRQESPSTKPGGH